MKSMKERERIAKHRQAKTEAKAAAKAEEQRKREQEQRQTAIASFPTELRERMEEYLSEAEAIMGRNSAVTVWDDLPESDVKKIGYLTCSAFGEYDHSKFPADLRDRIDRFYEWDYSLGGYDD